MTGFRAFRIFLILLPACLASLSLTAAQNVAATHQPSIPADPLPSFATTLKKSIAFLEARCIDGSNQPVISRATAFFVFQPDNRLGKDAGFGYIVSNRHAAQPSLELGRPCKVISYTLEVNARAESDAELPKLTTLPLGPDIPWIYPEDPSIDLAIFPAFLDQKKFDYSFVPTSVFATDEIMKSAAVSEGDPVLFSGLFVQLPGLLRLEPIVRQGIIAMIPTEPVLTTLGKPGKVYLADVHVFGGNSGSPMFVNLGGVRNGSLFIDSNYKLLGIVSGYELEDATFNLQPTTTLVGKVGANSGVTMVVPAQQLKALIDSPAAQTQRDTIISGNKK